MEILAIIAIILFFVGVVVRVFEPNQEIPWDRASTYISMTRELLMWAIVFAILFS